MYTISQIRSIVSNLSELAHVSKDNLVVTGSAAAVALGYLDEAVGVSITADNETFAKLVNALVGNGTCQLDMATPYDDKGWKVWRLMYIDPCIKINIFNVHHAAHEVFNTTTFTALTKDALVKQLLLMDNETSQTLLTLIHAHNPETLHDDMLSELEQVLFNKSPGFSRRSLAKIAEEAAVVLSKYRG